MEIIIVGILVWPIVVGVINLGLLEFDKGVFIKIHNTKKYQNKETPIYEIGQFELYSSDYWVRKYELKWSKDFTLICLIIPGLVGFNKFKYVEVGDFYVCPYREISNIIKSLEEIWEENYSEHLEQLEEERNLEVKRDKKIEKLNKKFNRNY